MTARSMKLCVHTQLTGVPYSGTYEGSSIPHRCKIVSKLQNAHTKSGAHETSYLMGNVGRAAGV
jgi:hypothetical protein